MKISKWVVKDITFAKSERKKVSGYIKRMSKNGWLINQGVVIDGVVYGDPNDHDKESEDIQIILR